MSTRESHYLMFGYKFPYIKSEDEDGEDIDFGDLESSYHADKDVGKVKLIGDGMGGKYSIVGAVIAAGSHGEGLGMTVLPSHREATMKYGDELVAALEKLKLVPDVAAEYIVFTHYS